MADRFMEYLVPVYRELYFSGNLAAGANVFGAIDKFLPYLKDAKPFFGGSDHLTLGISWIGFICGDMSNTV
jgi:hypothetical protein